MTARRKGEQLDNKRNPLNPNDMTDEELLGYLLPQTGASEVSKAIGGDVRNLRGQDIRDFAALRGVGAATRMKIGAFFVLAYRLFSQDPQNTENTVTE